MVCCKSDFSKVCYSNIAKHFVVWHETANLILNNVGGERKGFLKEKRNFK